MSFRSSAQTDVSRVSHGRAGGPKAPMSPKPRFLENVSFRQRFVLRSEIYIGSEGRRARGSVSGWAGWEVGDGRVGTAEMCEPPEDARVLLCGQKCLILLPMSASEKFDLASWVHAFGRSFEN